MDNLNKSSEKQIRFQDANPITLLKNPSKFKDTFYQLTALVSTLLKSQDYEKAIQNLSKIFDMLDLGKTILKDISKFWKLCLSANFACAYQGVWKMQKCHKYCEKIEEEIQKLIEDQGTKQLNLNLISFMIKFKFQHCAILSQLNHHEKALEKCKSTIPTLKNYIKQILQYVQAINADRPNKKSTEIVHFKKQVCSYAQTILENLSQSLQNPIEISKKSQFYYWQKNPQNNEEQVKRRFINAKGESCKRSILGVNKNVHWIDEFNIGTLMHMSEISITDFEEPLPLEQYLFRDKLFQIVIHCSVAHFTIATEMRFLQASKPSENKKQLNNFNTINAKYGYNQRSELFKLSEMYHLKAIDIMSKNIQTTVPYISHLIKSYDKHYIYKKQLQPIIAEQSSISMTQPNMSHQRASSANPQQDIYFQNSLNFQKQHITLDLQLKKEKRVTIEEPMEELTKSRKIEKNDMQVVSSMFLGETQRKQNHKSVEGKFKLHSNKKKKEQKGKKMVKKRRQTSSKEIKFHHNSCTRIKLFVKKKK